MRIIASFLRYTGDINFIKKTPISPVLLLILAHVLRTELFISLTSCLTTIKNHVIKYCETVIEKNDKNLLWPIKISGEILDKLKSKGFLASELELNKANSFDTEAPFRTLAVYNEWLSFI